MNRSIYDEPLRLIEDIVMTDQPYTRVVTAGYTMADPTVATVWGMAHSGRDRWERTAWTDDRGAAGILASTAVFLRHRSVDDNFNRSRANAISRGLLCHDFSESDIRIDGSVDLSRPDVIADAVVHNRSCAGCHQAMDPLASYFFPHFQGFMPGVIADGYPISLYSAAQADQWMTTTGRPPGYFYAHSSPSSTAGSTASSSSRTTRCSTTPRRCSTTPSPRAAIPAARGPSPSPRC